MYLTILETIPEQPQFFENFNLENISTLVNYKELEWLLKETKYDPLETDLVQGFKNGFDLQYQGPTCRQSEAKNLLIMVGSKVEIWNKLMKEVQLKWVAGPFKVVPFENYIQSPIRLVPKAGSDKTRLIFHLSHDLSSEEHDRLVNYYTPKLCSMKYCDLDHAVRNYILLRDTEYEQRRSQGATYKDNQLVVVFAGKTDVQSAFRLVPLLKKCWAWLVMKAEHPHTKQMMYFVDKCLPFGASISCAHFQRVSNGLKHITQITIVRCNYLLNAFLDICHQVGFPISLDKTQWASEVITFLGVLLNGHQYVLSIPLEKKQKAEHLLDKMLNKTKSTVKDLQALCGYLNFLGRAVNPG